MPQVKLIFKQLIVHNDLALGHEVVQQQRGPLLSDERQIELTFIFRSIPEIRELNVCRYTRVQLHQPGCNIEYWFDDESFKVDDGTVVLKPNSVPLTDPGRWLAVDCGDGNTTDPHLLYGPLHSDVETDGPAVANLREGDYLSWNVAKQRFSIRPGVSDCCKEGNNAEGPLILPEPCGYSCSAIEDKIATISGVDLVASGFASDLTDTPGNGGITAGPIINRAAGADPADTLYGNFLNSSSWPVSSSNPTFCTTPLLSRWNGIDTGSGSSVSDWSNTKYKGLGDNMSFGGAYYTYEDTGVGALCGFGADWWDGINNNPVGDQPTSGISYTVEWSSSTGRITYHQGSDTDGDQSVRLSITKPEWRGIISGVRRWVVFSVHVARTNSSVTLTVTGQAIGGAKVSASAFTASRESGLPISTWDTGWNTDNPALDHRRTPVLGSPIGAASNVYSGHMLYAWVKKGQFQADIESELLEAFQQNHAGYVNLSNKPCVDQDDVLIYDRATGGWIADKRWPVGNINQHLVRTGPGNKDVAFVDEISDLPDGGLTGYQLVKASNVNQDLAWVQRDSQTFFTGSDPGSVALAGDLWYSEAS